MATTQNIEVGIGWSDDIALGVEQLLIQLRGNAAVVVYVHTVAPSADSSEGIVLDQGGDRGLDLTISASDKVFVRALRFPSTIAVVKS